jgi:phospholipid/cholesterol/gamma-HCH transport system substrate-binding protein
MADGNDDVYDPPMSRQQRWRRMLALGALLAGLAALLVVVLARDDSHSYRFMFENAGQLVEGDLVRIGGTPAGEIESIELSDDGQAEVSVSIDGDFAPLHAGSTATIRAASLIGVANRYVDVHPGPNFHSELDDGAVLAADNTTTIVDLDQLFNALDPPTRAGLEQVIDGFSSWYGGHEAEANESARYLAPALGSFARLTKEVNRDSTAFERFLVESADALGAIAERRGELTDLVGNTGATLRALSSDTASLSQALVELPPALARGSDTLAELRPALGDVQRLMEELDPVAPELAPFLRRLAAFAGTARPTVGELRLMLDNPGAGNDLVDALRDAPRLARLSETALPRTRRALRDAEPIFAFARPYTPDLTAWMRSFGGAMAPYDANGHYARTMAVFDAFEFVDDPEGGHLDPKGPAARGQSPNLSLGNLRRCPGAGTRAPADGSAPFVDSGDLSNPDCDPSQTVGASP